MQEGIEAEEEADDLDVDFVIGEDVDLFDVEDVDFAVVLDCVDELVFKVELVPVDLLVLEDVDLDVDEVLVAMEEVDLFAEIDDDFAVEVDFIEELIFELGGGWADDVLPVDVDETTGFVTRQEQGEDTFAGAFEHCET